MANPNVFNGSSLYGNIAIAVATTSYANLVQNPSSSGSLYKIKSLTVTNSCTSPVAMSVQLNQAGTNNFIAANIAVPTSAVLVILAKDTELYLLENSSLQINASSASYITVTASWDQIS